MHFEVGLLNRSKHLMQIVQYLKDKFNPSRPMGRKNFVWSYLLTICVYAPIAWNLPGMDEMPASATTILLLQLISIPQNLLLFRRSSAAGIPTALVILCWFLTPIHLMAEGGLLEFAIHWYQFVLMLFILFKKNIVDPVAP
ncbi:hypothetical protein [Synechococcus sp. NOUM97013]|uniref:hypothetical protein n=1 Tax=Synechococcus sp. NOUM97013 TaxID=1442555 RepID=UPI001644D76E|nr:hypothetical protein [Synechococcus sp. NOUM97013]